MAALDDKNAHFSFDNYQELPIQAERAKIFAPNPKHSDIFFSSNFKIICYKVKRQCRKKFFAIFQKVDNPIRDAKLPESSRPPFHSEKLIALKKTD